MSAAPKGQRPPVDVSVRRKRRRRAVRRRIIARSQYPSTAAVKRQTRAARAAGLDVGAVITHRNGSIVVLDIKATGPFTNQGDDDAEAALRTFENHVAPAGSP